MPKDWTGKVALLFPLVFVACGDEAVGPGDSRQREPAVRCSDGEAASYSCRGLDLLAHVRPTELESQVELNFSAVNDLWGWTDRETGNDFVLVGRRDGVSILDVTDPIEPRAIARLPTAAGESDHRDIKVYQDHAFVAAGGAAGAGIQILDLRRLRALSAYAVLAEDARYEGIGSALNLAINEQTGYAYVVGSRDENALCGGGLHMLDVRNPTRPTLAGCFAQQGTGIDGTGYTYDVHCTVYDGPDSDHRGREICLSFNLDAMVIVDVTDKDVPTVLSIVGYDEWGYINQGVFDADQRYILQNDATEEFHGYVGQTKLRVWNAEDLDAPELVTEHTGPTAATDHNGYVRGTFAYLSNYEYGVRVLDIRDPRQPKELAHFDTHPGSDFAGFNGSWSNYPFPESEVIAVSSTRDGLFLLQLQ